MEIVTSFGSQAQTVPVSLDSLLRLKQGLLKIRQRPGGKNALGRIKFIFPNKEDVYLHDTPANSLFNRSRRDFSHGCVRVENPEGLANFALKDQKGWGEKEIKEALSSGKSQWVTLKKSIPVLFFYITTFVDQNDHLDFYPDIYGHDQVLMEALKKSIPVLFFYITTFVDQNDHLDFYPDIYGHDQVLMEALKKSQDISDQSLFISENISPETSKN